VYVEYRARVRSREFARARAASAQRWSVVPLSLSHPRRHSDSDRVVQRKYISPPWSFHGRCSINPAVRVDGTITTKTAVSWIKPTLADCSAWQVTDDRRDELEARVWTLKGEVAIPSTTSPSILTKLCEARKSSYLSPDNTSEEIGNADWPRPCKGTKESFVRGEQLEANNFDSSSGLRGSIFELSFLIVVEIHFRVFLPKMYERASPMEYFDDDSARKGGKCFVS